jgi:type I restriction-modification system DNA methylase subunit
VHLYHSQLRKKVYIKQHLKPEWQPKQKLEQQLWNIAKHLRGKMDADDLEITY